MRHTSEFPHPVDRQVGANIRRLREAAGLSQGQLAGPLGVTFQQVQKYEKGSNRVAPSKLAGMAARLGVPIMAFFEGCEAVAAGRTVAVPVKSRRKQQAFKHLHAIEGPEFIAASARLLKTFKQLDQARRHPEKQAAG